MIREHRRRLYWLNPLLSGPNYQPICQGMSVALPHLDYFLPFYNLKTLEDFCRRLEDADDMARWSGERICAKTCEAFEAGKEL